MQKWSLSLHSQSTTTTKQQNQAVHTRRTSPSMKCRYLNSTMFTRVMRWGRGKLSKEYETVHNQWLYISSCRDMQHTTIGDFMFRQRYVTLLMSLTFKFHCCCLRLLTEHMQVSLLLYYLLLSVNQTSQDKKLAGLMCTHFMHAVLLFHTG